MPSASGVYSLPVGYLAVTGAVIQASQHNPPLEDIAAALTARLSRDGTAPMTGALKLADGVVTLPGLGFNSDPTTGLYKTTAGFGVAVAGAKVAEFGTTGLLSGIVTTSLADKTVTLAKLYHPSAVARLLGSDANAALSVTGAVNNGSGLIRLVVASTATFATSQVKTVSDVTGTTEANGTFVITVVDATHIDLVGSAFVNAYVSGGTIGGGVEEIALGTGLSMSAGPTLNSSAPSLAGAIGLLVTNNAGTPNSKIDITADQVVMLNASNVAIFAAAVSVTIDTSTTGAGGMDVGSRPTSGWVNVFLINNGTTTAGLASLSATAPTMPTGYTSSTRVGAMRTDSSQNFLRTRQTGRDAVYTPVTASNTTALPTMASGGAAANTAIATGAFVPPTAIKIKVVGFASMSTNQSFAIYPNNNYPGAGTGATAGYPLGHTNSQTNQTVVDLLGELTLESTNIYYGSAGTSPTISAYGWTDKVNAN